MTASGGKMPLDVDPSDVGNVRIRVEDGELIATVHGKDAAGKLRAEGVSMYTSHHFTCKHGKHWKGGGGPLQQTIDGGEVPLAAVNEEAGDGEVRG